LKERVLRLGTREPQKALPMPPRNLFALLPLTSTGNCMQPRFIERDESIELNFVS